MNVPEETICVPPLDADVEALLKTLPQPPEALAEHGEPPPLLGTRIDTDRADSSAETGGEKDGESWDPDEFLPPEEPAPPLPKGSSSNPGHESLDRLLAPVVVRLIFQLGKTLSTPEIWKEVPPPKPSPRRLNRVGDFLGRGAGKKSLRLWPGAGVFAPCQENVVICLHRLTEEEIKDLAHSLGYPTRPAFEAAIAALPSAKVGTTP